MNINVQLGEQDLDRIATQVAAAIKNELRPEPAPWFDTRSAAVHLDMSEHAIRALVKRSRLPFHRTGSGRIRFDRDELDAWVREQN